MGSLDLKTGDVVELVKINPMGSSTYSSKVIEIKGSGRLLISACSIGGKRVTLPPAGNYQLRYLTSEGHFKVAVKIAEATSELRGSSIILGIEGEHHPVSLSDYVKTVCDIAVRFSSLFNPTLRGNGLLIELSGGGAKLSTPCLISVGDTVQFPLELVGCDDMIITARVIDVNEQAEGYLYSLAFTDMHVRLRRQLMDYVESV